MGRVLLIGLDGATYRVLDDLVARGVMPELAALQQRAARTELLSTPNAFTPPAWTSLMTGVGPGEHGIFDFVRVLPGEGRPSYSMATSRDVHHETIWSIASRHDLRVAALNFPLMFPPRPVNGFVVPGFVPPRHLQRFVHPAWFYDRIRAQPGFDESELLLDMDIERESLQTLPDDRYEEWIDLHTRREAQWARIAELLITEEEPDLMAVLFDGVDKLQHLCWRFLDPELFPHLPSAFERRVRECCLTYFRRLDDHIGRLVAAAGPDTHVVVCSDHGFGPTAELFYVNVLLAQHGYLRWAPGARPDHAARQMTSGHRNPTVLFDWENTRAYALTAGSNGVYVKARPDDRAALCREVADVLLEYVNPRTGTHPVRRVLFRDEAFPGPQSHLAPDLTLVLRDYGFVSILNAEEVLAPRLEIAGTHAPEGIVLAAGPAAATGPSTARPQIQDIAPLVLHLLDVPIPPDLSGTLPTGLLDAGWLRMHPEVAGEPTESPDPFFDSDGATLDPSGEGEVIDRLRALGYVE